MLPFGPDSVVLASLIGSCRVHVNELIGAHIEKKLMDAEPQSSYPYVLLSNLHASSGNWEEVSTMRKIMKEKQVNKFPGCSWIIIGDRTNSFVAGDKCHPESVEIYELLNSISAWIKEEDLVKPYGGRYLHPTILVIAGSVGRTILAGGSSDKLLFQNSYLLTSSVKNSEN
ncbi:hypothetical protein EJ110_NYTH22361 [Nymphaea thermarum]|nr:hypothetical protein EJ110_NYTH22361 [Nymphaea thermarum]